MFFIFLAFSLLASAISTNKVILYALAPAFLVGIRMTVAALLLGVYSVIFERHSWKQVKQYAPWFIVIAFFTTFFPANLKAYALAHMPSSKMAFFGTLDPFVAVFFSYFFYHEQLTARKWVGILIGFLGMMVLIFTMSPAEESLKAFSIVSYAELAAFLAIVLSRFGWILAQQLLKKELLSPVQLNIITMSIGGIISLGAAFIGNQMSVTSLSVAPVPLLQEPPLSLLGPNTQLSVLLAYTIIVGNMLGYTFYAHALKRYSITFIALAGFSVPLLVHLFGWLFLHESLSFMFFVACLITFLGMIIFFSEERKEGHN